MTSRTVLKALDIEPRELTCRGIMVPAHLLPTPPRRRRYEVYAALLRGPHLDAFEAGIGDYEVCRCPACDAVDLEVG